MDRVDNMKKFIVMFFLILGLFSFINPTYTDAALSYRDTYNVLPDYDDSLYMNFVVYTKNNTGTLVTVYHYYVLKEDFSSVYYDKSNGSVSFVRSTGKSSIRYYFYKSYSDKSITREPSNTSNVLTSSTNPLKFTVDSTSSTTYKFLYTDTPIYDQGGNLIFSGSDTMIPTTDITNYNFTGLKILPSSEYGKGATSLITVYGNIPCPDLDYDSDEAYKKLSAYAKDLKLTLNGKEIKSIFNTYAWHYYKNSHYTFKVTFHVNNIPHATGTNQPMALTIGGKFITGETGMLWWKEPQYTSFKDSYLYQSQFIDDDNDFIDDVTGEDLSRYDSTPMDPYDDNTMSIYPDDSSPKRSNYVDGILGSIEYGFDMIIHFLMYPFELIGSGLIKLTSSVTTSIGWATGFTKVITSIFGFLPTEVTGLISASIVATLVVSILRLFRG